MDYRQYRRARKLVHECCNYIAGNCIALDDGEECICVQSISYSLLCRWFRAAVLPQDKELETALFHRLNAKKCAVCGALFTPGSNRAKYLSLIHIYKLLKEIKARITRLYRWSKAEAEKPQTQQSSLTALWEAQQQLNTSRTRTGSILTAESNAYIVNPR